MGARSFVIVWSPRFMVIGFALMVLGAFIVCRAVLVPLGAALIGYGILSRVAAGQRKRRIELKPILA